MLHGSRVMRGAAGAQAGGSVVQTIESARKRPAGGRIPPHNIEAEESLLGAMLLSRDAIVAAVEARVEANDFYKPAHGHVFDAVMGLYGQGEPADPVTVAEELRRADLLDFVGGPRDAAVDPGGHARVGERESTPRGSSTSSRCCAG